MIPELVFDLQDLRDTKLGRAFRRELALLHWHFQNGVAFFDIAPPKGHLVVVCANAHTGECTVAISEEPIIDD